MDPLSSDHFHWQDAYFDPERFAKGLGITLRGEPAGAESSYSRENLSCPNLEQMLSSDPDSVHPSGRQTVLDFLFSDFHDGSSDFSQASVPHQFHQYVDSFDQCAPSGSSYPVLPNERAIIDEPSTTIPYGQYNEAAAFAELIASHPFGQNDHTAALDEPIGSQLLGQNAPHVYPTPDYSPPIHTPMTETSPATNFRATGVHVPSNYASSSRADESSEIARSTHSQPLDQKRLQELRASLAAPFPRAQAKGFAPSILSKSFRAFARSKSESILQCEKLGKIDCNINKSALEKILKIEKRDSFNPKIKHFNNIMNRNKIGKIEEIKRPSDYRFIKGENFHFVDIVCEASSKISQDFGVRNIPLKFLQIIAMLYGKSELSLKALSKMLQLHESSLSDSINVCNQYLIEHKSMVKIVMLVSGQSRYYHLSLDHPEHIT